MSTHSRAVLAQLDLDAATRMAAGADQIAAEVKAIQEIIAALIKGGAWKGPDAFSFGLRWERELTELGRTSANLHACANHLHSDAKSRLGDVAMAPADPRLGQPDVVA